MKAIAINGSPRSGWNTERMLLEALKGAAFAGFETEIVDLYSLDYTGCRSCFACKRKNAQKHQCCIKDDLSTVLDKVFHADVLFLGTPIYFGDFSGQMLCFLERLCFPLLSYDDFGKKIFDGHINTAFFFTMNAPKQFYESSMKQPLQNKADILRRLGGTVELYASCDTLQFDNYSDYHAAKFDEAHKKQVHEEQFPKDLLMAYEIGRRLASNFRGNFV